ncbi:unnamed protein product, partial [Aureobasidium vineae]
NVAPVCCVGIQKAVLYHDFLNDTNGRCYQAKGIHNKSMVNIVSDAFKSKMQPARHRMVYTLLKDEMAAEGGIHALQLKTRTLEEEEKVKARES